MSFYGSIQYQISNAFSQIFIHNSGLNVTDEFLPKIKDTYETIIEADGREGRLYLDSGNAWIKLKGDAADNSCKIYHGKANEKTAVNGIVSFDVVSDETEINEIKNHVSLIDLSDDVYLKSAHISYDATGHIFTRDTNQYFKIPKIQIQTDIDALRATVDAMGETIDGQGKKIDENASDIKEQEGKIKSIENTVGTDKSILTGSSTVNLCNAIGNIDTLRTNLDTQKNICQILMDAYSNINSQQASLLLHADSILSLQDDIRELKTQLEALKK